MYDFSVNYNAIDISNIMVINKYLMKKNDMFVININQYTNYYISNQYFFIILNLERLLIHKYKTRLFKS